MWVHGHPEADTDPFHRSVRVVQSNRKWVLGSKPASTNTMSTNLSSDMGCRSTCSQHSQRKPVALR